jgi:hypothetical protein
VNLNNLVPGTEFEGKTLEEIVKTLRAASSTTPLRSGTTPSTGTAWRQTAAANLPAPWLKPSTPLSVRSTSSRKIHQDLHRHLRFRLGLAGEEG